MILLGVLLLCSQSASALRIPATSRAMTAIHMSNNNADMFGSGSKRPVTAGNAGGMTPSDYNLSVDGNKGRLEGEAAKLRREAAEMELELRDEARKKGLPEQVIDKLVPLRGSAKPLKTSTGGAVAVQSKPVQTLSSGEVRKKLGYLNVGDAVRFTSELDRIKSKGILQMWNSKDVSKTNFAVNNYQLKSKTGIEPVDLRLDDVGFEYQKVFFVALAGASVFAISSNFIGGQLGFIFGYLSALFPIGLVGIGSIAPGLIGDAIKFFQYQVDEKARDGRVRNNAAKFLTGYVTGLPISNFRTGGVANSVEYFQLRPTGKEDDSFERSKITQEGIARASIMCVAGSVAECMEYTIASGSSPGDVNTLYELMNAVEPKLKPEEVQNHIRWSVVNANAILKENEEVYKRLCVAFAEGEGLEECIGIVEGKA